MTKDTENAIGYVRFIIQGGLLALMIWVIATVSDVSATVKVQEEQYKNLLEMKEDIKEMRREIKANRELLIELKHD